MTLASLIERVEKAETGSRELDCRVTAWGEGVAEGEPWSEDDLAYALTDPDRTCNPPPVTTSLDAALALASRVIAHRGPIDLSIAGSAQAVIHSADPCGKPLALAFGHTPALALVLAVLRAKENEDG